MNVGKMHVKILSLRSGHLESTQEKIVPPHPPSFLFRRTRFTNTFTLKISQIVMIKFSLFKNLRVNTGIVSYVERNA